MSSFVAQWESIGFRVRTITATGFKEIVQDSEGEVVIVLAGSIEFHCGNLDLSRHSVQILSWELGGFDLSNFRFDPVEAIDGGVANELDQSKVEPFGDHQPELVRGCSGGTRRLRGRWLDRTRRTSQQSTGLVWWQIRR